MWFELGTDQHGNQVSTAAWLPSAPSCLLSSQTPPGAPPQAASLSVSSCPEGTQGGLSRTSYRKQRLSHGRGITLHLLREESPSQQEAEPLEPENAQAQSESFPAASAVETRAANGLGDPESQSSGSGHLSFYLSLSFHLVSSHRGCTVPAGIPPVAWSSLPLSISFPLYLHFRIIHPNPTGQTGPLRESSGNFMGKTIASEAIVRQ